MKWTEVCPLLGVALIACATAEENFPSGLGLTTSTSGSSGTDAGTSGAGAGVDNAASGSGGGSDTSGGVSSSGSGGAGQAGAEGGSGGTYMYNGGAFGTSGTPASAGMSGNGGAGPGAGGRASGGAGAGGKANGGAAGVGGAANAQCQGVTIPAKSKWKGSASKETNDAPASKVFDGDNASRFTTGVAQNGDEWLEIDFGAAVTLNEVTMHTNNDDYFRHYQLRLSNTSKDFAAAILKEDNGKTGTITVPLAQAKTGRYLTIKQTGKVTPDWWSLHEVSVACK